MADEECNIVEVVDEDGNTLEFEVVANFDVEGKLYAVLAPCHEDSDESEEGEDAGETSAEDDEEEYLICRVEDDGEGGQNLVEIEDDEEYERVLEVLDELFADEVLGEDEEDEEKGDQ